MADFNSRRLEIDALRTLWAVRNHGGVTRAAEALGLSQSAVSHKIKRLETSLDCQLLSRRPGEAPRQAKAFRELFQVLRAQLAVHGDEDHGEQAAAESREADA